MRVSARIAASTVGALAALAVPSAAIAKGPSRAQIRAAVRAAEHSKQLWATINICNSQHHKDQVGIRGEMPSLGFKTQMYMTFEVVFRVSATAAFQPLPATRATALVGQASNRALQLGRTYPFVPSPAQFAARITFTWAQGKKVLGRTTRKTTGHHHHVDFSDPPGFSRATCRIT